MGQGPKILIIDDDPDIRDALSMILGSQNYQVTTASFGAEGLEKAKQDIPDLIILDLIMPGMGGFAVYKKLKDSKRPEWNNIKILILTSLREDATRTQFELETGMELAVDDYVEKPISSRIILQKVGKILNET